MRAATGVALAGVLLGAVPAPAAGPAGPAGPEQVTVIRLVALPDRMFTRIDEGLMRPGSLEEVQGGGLVLSEQECYRLLEWVQGDVTASVTTRPSLRTRPDAPIDFDLFGYALRVSADPAGDDVTRLQVIGRVQKKPLVRVAIDRALRPGQCYALGGWVAGESDDRGDVRRLVVLVETRPPDR